MYKKMLLILIWITGSASSQNFLSNGSFDSDIIAWEGNAAHIDLSWVSNDGGNANGSLQISSDFNNGGVGTTFHAPVAVDENKTYTFSANVRVMANTEAQGATMIIYWLDENQFSVGFTEYIYSDTNTPHGNWHAISESFQPPTGMKYAQVYVGVDSSNSGTSDPAIARWDDIRMEEQGASGFNVLNSHTGLWFNRDQSGHGLNVEILDDGRAVVVWYTYDANGNQIWLLGIGTHDGQKLTLDVKITDGAMFPPNFDSQDVNQVDWGQFTLQFSNCDEAVFKWMPIAGNGYAAGEMTVHRLTKIANLQCNN